MDSQASEIVSTAARLVAEEGLEYGPAKRRALKELGLPARTPLPGNEALELAVREYLALFCADTQPRELALLRALAVQWLRRLAAFQPYVSGAVWHGTATRWSDIYLQLFCDDHKALEIELINQRVAYDARTVTGLHGDPVEALTVEVPCQELGIRVGVHLLVYDLDGIRGALKPDAQGRSPRGDLRALLAIMGEESGSV